MSLQKGKLEEEDKIVISDTVEFYPLISVLLLPNFDPFA